MRHSLPTYLALLSTAGLLSGCAMAPQGASVSDAQPFTATVHGASFGGQLPVSGATIEIYTYGTTGYGSTGTLLGTATTATDGSFNVTFTCPTATTPVYALSVGGNSLGGNPKTSSNSAIVEAAALGTCSFADAAQFIVVNEISTAVLATALSHFLSAGNGITTSDGTTRDHFGGPASTSASIANTNNVLIPAMLSLSNGTPNASTSTFTNEASKITTLGNILAACVNTSSNTSTPCATLFNNAKTSFTPTNILEAAVNIALNPLANVTNLYNSVTASGAPAVAFTGGLTAVPNDWSLGVSYTSSNFGLGILARGLSTIDVDANGKVWFPSNNPASAGLGYFDPSAGNFGAKLTYTGAFYPLQVAVNNNGYVWVADAQDGSIPYFSVGSSTTAPAYVNSVGLNGFTATSVTTAYDGTMRLGLYQFTGNTDTSKLAWAQISGLGTGAGSTTTSSFSVLGNATFQANNFYISSTAGDSVGGFATNITDIFDTNQDYTYGYYWTPGTNPQLRNAIADSGQDGGQVAFTSAGFVAARGGTSKIADGICIFNTQKCYSNQNQTANQHPSGAAVDGLGNLWLANNLTASVAEIAQSEGGSTSYLDSNTVPNNQNLVHNSSNGGTLVNPLGIAVDRTGNVWVSNYSCATLFCTPGAFVLSEIVGVAAPTVTPVAQQVVVGNGPSEPQAVAGGNMMPR